MVIMVWYLPISCAAQGNSGGTLENGVLLIQLVTPWRDHVC